ncbi:DNA internalization-related competence protein ComEC/Rec2 [Candidatus Pantoea deserta]|uniref:DNA internalization-related competence protein ComEC/Rec2 n=1 Tax=Candidatus Pantoea deserta TaxID=1869313 RepID=A0A3N4NXL6_9GAMM|nr:DNA internalization-related competence protein ComEC/Rec2 [Pantoea deserta]RPD96319.1 DNA internalization-related competence protein ComEC/Rec2 [Pantoea deserta]
MMTGTLLARIALISALPLLFLPRLPSALAILLMAIAGMLLLWTKIAWLPAAGVALLMLAWMLSAARSTVAAIETASAAPASYSVRIAEVRPDRQQIRVQLVRREGRYLFPPRFAWLSLRNNQQSYCPGERWSMLLSLRPVHAKLNEGEFDAQRFALANHTGVSGRILRQQPESLRCSWRWQRIERDRPVIGALPQGAILMALAFGERAEMSNALRQLLRETGTAHLMAISGMHIALAASCGWLIARAVQLLLPVRYISYLFPLAMSWLFAALYSWLSGSNAPAQRALIALTLWMILRIRGAQLSGWQVWTFCVGGLLLFDPMNVLSESFWLSALAVAILLTWYHWFPLPARCRHGWFWFPVQLFHLQLGMLLLMAPLQVVLFEGISLSALAANMLAIPVITFISVPLILLAMLMPVGSLCAGLWWLADRSVVWLMAALKILPAGWWPFYDAASLALLVWGGLIVWRCALAYAAPVSWMALVLALLVWRWPREEPGWRIDMLDVGQGLSVVIRQGKNALLYDTGPRWENGDAGTRHIIPWLSRKHLNLQHIVLSHRHLDHSGGLDAIVRRWPEVPIRSATLDARHQPCVRGTRWRWGRLNISVLWPLRLSDVSNNNDSCVLSVDDGVTRLLLTGDLEASAERQLVALEKHRLHAAIIQVPHHGSRTSSTPLLLRNVAGQIALASAARYNAWRMPVASVVENYRRAGYRWYDTARSGQLSLCVADGKINVFSLREQIFPRWYHQRFGVKQESR